MHTPLIHTEEITLRFIETPFHLPIMSLAVLSNMPIAFRVNTKWHLITYLNLDVNSMQEQVCDNYHFDINPLAIAAATVSSSPWLTGEKASLKCQRGNNEKL